MRNKNILLLTLCMVGCVCTSRAADEDDIEYFQNESIPLVVINTIDAEEPTYDVVDHPEGCMGQSITNVTKVKGRIMIVLGQDILYDSGDYVKDESGMTVKVRGNTSATYYAKKPYKIKLQKKADLLCRGNDKVYKDKEWVLITNSGYLSNHLVGLATTRFMGFAWAPAAELVNVVMNGTYRGIYMLAEQVKCNNDCRIDVDEDTGYIIEYDPYWWNEDVYFNSSIRYDYNYTFKYPDSDDVTQEQIDYIQGVTDRVEASLDDGTYPDYINVPSFARWMLTHDLLGTYDSGGSNMFLSKYDNTEESKIQMETPWDFDSIEQTEDVWARRHTSSSFYYSKLFDSTNGEFVEEYKSMWKEISDEAVGEIVNWLDSLANSNLPSALDYYSDLDKKVSGLDYPSFEEELEHHKEWFVSRKEWLDENVPSLVAAGIERVECSAGQVSKTYYNLCGQRVDDAYGGIVVTEGKKFVRR